MSDEAEQLSGGYLYRDEGPDTKELLSGRAGMASIHGRVVRYRYNDNFIVAVQCPVYAEYRDGVGFELREDLRKYPTNSAAEIAASERVADSLLTHDQQYQAILRWSGESGENWVLNSQLHGKSPSHETAAV
ncbi:hypothetical protein E4631_24285 [Hymenobacter sp. UV11]|nr:hypothetical protein E4631_24285 [Hymenobacter sp. UV11]